MGRVFFRGKLTTQHKTCKCVNRYVSNNLHICIFAHLRICTLLAIPVNDIQYHFILLQLRQVIKQDVMFFGV